MAKNKGGREVRKPKQAAAPKASANAPTTLKTAGTVSAADKKRRGA